MNEKLQYKILIDSSDRYQKSVGLISTKNREIDSVSGDIDIVSEIKNLLEKNKLRVEDISEFVANPGPGSFTGLKVGVTIANVLNWALGRKGLKELMYPNYGKEPNIQKPAML